MEQRIQKILAAAGFGSRRYCETLIADGRVAVNGQIVTDLGSKADMDRDKIKVDGKTVKAVMRKVYLVLNKPKGYTSTCKDPHAEHTVLELVSDLEIPVYPVGRLDVDTRGLLIMTNDGDFANAVTHPSREIEKEYQVTVQGRISPEDLQKLEMGIELEDGLTAPAKVSFMGYTENRGRSMVTIVIHEGRKRQVKRMFAAVNHKVLELRRTRIGTLRLSSLPEGKWRNLSGSEIAGLLGTTKSKKQTTRKPN